MNQLGSIFCPRYNCWAVLPVPLEKQDGLHKRASRLRATHIFEKRRSKPSVSSTPNAHSKNQVPPRLRQTTFFSENLRLAYTKHLLWVSDGATEDRDKWGDGCNCILKSVVSCTRNLHFAETAFPDKRFVYAK